MGKVNAAHALQRLVSGMPGEPIHLLSVPAGACTSSSHWGGDKVFPRPSKDIIKTDRTNPKDNLERPFDLTFMFLDCRRKAEFPDRADTSTGRTHKLNAERPQARISTYYLFLQGNISTNHATLQPHTKRMKGRHKRSDHLKTRSVIWQHWRKGNSLKEKLKVGGWKTKEGLTLIAVTVAVNNTHYLFIVAKVSEWDLISSRRTSFPPK